MNFEISQEQEMLKKMVRDFAESEIAPRIEELDKTETFSLDITKKMGELGLFGMTVPEKDGGQGLDYLSYVMVIEELSRVDASHAATVAAENSLGIGPIAAFGTEAQKQNYLPTLLAGTALWGFGLTEPNAGSDAAGTQTTAELKNGMWTINGSKIFITISII